MCDFGMILGAIAAAQVFIVAAIALTVVAIAANSSFFAAPTAVVPFGLALVSAFSGASSLWLASSLLADPACAAAAACSAELATARAAIDFLTAALMAATVLGIAAAILSAVPIAGGIAMIGYSVGLGIVATGIGPATQAVAALQACADAATDSTAADVLVVTGYVVSLVGLGFLIVTGGSIGNDRRDGTDPFTPGGGTNPD